MKLKLSFLLLFLLTPLALVHIQENSYKVVKPEQLSLTPLEPITEKLNVSAEEKIVAELMAQNIFKQQCEDSPLCDFLPAKVSPVLKYVKFDYKKIKHYQTLSYEENIALLKKESGSKTIEKVDLFLQGTCPRNLSAAWLRKNESEIRLKHKDLLEKMYNFVGECTPTIDHEEMYLKQALYFFHEKQYLKAEEAITKALQVVNQEKMRIYYWAGKILNQHQYFEEVISNYPYSFHAISAAKELKKDLFLQILKRNNYTNQPFQSSFVEIVKSLLTFEHFDAVDKLIRLNVNNSKISNQEMFYVNRLVAHYAPSQYGIWMVARLSHARSDYLNNQVLQLVYEKPYFETFSEQASLFNLDPYLLLSLSKQESGFNYKAQSSAKAMGLMQLLPSTAKQVSKVKKTQLFDPEVNIQVGTKYFNELYEKYQSIEPALAAYNAGPYRVDQWLKLYSTENSLLFMDLIPFKETRSYVGLILRNHYYYKNLNKK